MLTTTPRTSAPVDPTPDTPVAPSARPPRGLDARLAAAEAHMTVQLDLAGLALSVNSRTAEDPLDLDDVVRGPVALPEPPEPPYPTPAAATLQRARRRLRDGGWCQGATVDDEGARCLYGAVRAEAPTAGVESDALAVLLEAIRRRFPGADTVPDANDHHIGSWHTAVQLLGDAARIADARGL